MCPLEYAKPAEHVVEMTPTFRARLLAAGLIDIAVIGVAIAVQVAVTFIIPRIWGVWGREVIGLTLLFSTIWLIPIVLLEVVSAQSLGMRVMRLVFKCCDSGGQPARGELGARFLLMLAPVIVGWHIAVPLIILFDLDPMGQMQRALYLMIVVAPLALWAPVFWDGRSVPDRLMGVSVAPMRRGRRAP